jgi:4-diphosphocytidyl-2-C-methyl-D-erythritol kinase
LARESIPGRPPGVRVVLHKRVPSPAGLGGGSSDAASALALGEKLWGVKGSEDWRRNVLVGLGADCSFFHGVGDSSLALCEGVGEAVTPWPGQAPAVWVALLVPEAICPTGQIFGALAQQRAMLGDCPFDSSQPLHGLDLEGLRGGLATDLEAAALCAVPVLGRWRSLLDSEGAQHWLLSGSGCAFFGLYADEGIARAETDRLVQLAAAEGLSLRGDFVTRPRRP